MNSTMLFAPAALVVAGFFANPSHAHERVTATVGLPPLVVDVGDVHVAVGQPLPPPPPPVVVVEEPQPEVVVVRETTYYPQPRQVVYVQPRERQRVVYVDDDCDHHHPRGNAYGYWKNHAKHHRR
jgi:hypothetical protein